jgi:hypothetical protein
MFLLMPLSTIHNIEVDHPNPADSLGNLPLAEQQTRREQQQGAEYEERRCCARRESSPFQLDDGIAVRMHAEPESVCEIAHAQCPPNPISATG